MRRSEADDSDGSTSDSAQNESPLDDALNVTPSHFQSILGKIMLSKRTARAYATNADTAPGFWMIGVLWRMLATGVQTGNSMCLLDQFCSRLSGPARHVHSQEEGLYVASGKVTFSAGGTELVAPPGSLVTVPRHTEHSFIVDEEAILINFYFPAGFDLWLMGSAVPAQRNELPPAEFPPLPSSDLAKRLSDDYGGMPLTQERSTSANPDAPAMPTITSRQTAENFWFDRGCWSILADGASTGGSYSVFEAELRRGPADDLSILEQADKAYYVFDGELEFFVDDQMFTLRKGSFAFIPRGSLAAFRVLSETARFLNIVTTPGYERVIRLTGTRTREAVVPSYDWRQHGASPERLNELYADIGLRNIKVPAGFIASGMP